MTCDLIQTISIAVGAIGTIAVAALAIWGSWIRYYFMRPKLVFSLPDSKGDLNKRNDNKMVRYYHVKLSNKRSWSPAERVRVMLTSISRVGADHKTYYRVPLMVPMQLTWSFSMINELLPNIGPERYADIGYLVENDAAFLISLYVTPGNFEGYVRANDSICIELIAMADNLPVSAPYRLEISWDGQWSTDNDKMQSHLVIKEIN